LAARLGLGLRARRGIRRGPAVAAVARARAAVGLGDRGGGGGRGRGGVVGLCGDGGLWGFQAVCSLLIAVRVSQGPGGGSSGGASGASRPAIKSGRGIALRGSIAGA